MEAAGTDSDGREFKNPDEMWLEHTGDNNKKTQWYRDGVAYWEGVEASVNGVLGGYEHVNDADVKGSEGFLQTLLAELFVDGGIDRHLVALDCGSGIGRITKNLLIRYFNEVDLLEPVSHFLDAARESLVQENHMASDKHKATNFYCVPLQEFTPDVGRYDVIWVQWCIGHLTDDDFVSFFKRAKIGLKPGGFFVLKENLARSGFVLDKEDRSITRSDSYFKGLFSQCGLHLYKSRASAKFIGEKYGSLNLLINASGILSIPNVLQPETTLSKVERSSLMLAYEVNAIGPILMIKHMWPLLKAGGGFGTERDVAVVANLSARVGSIGDNHLGGWHSYRSSKAALNQLTKTVSVEFARKRDPIICILLHPGTVDTDLSKPFQRNVPEGKLFTKEFSVQKLLSIINNAKSHDNGKFFAWDGQEIPW